MATKRAHSPGLVENPFIKKRNLEWSLDITGKAHDAVGSSSSSSDEYGREEEEEEEKPTTISTSGDQGVVVGVVNEEPKAAAIEAGEAAVHDHLGHFSNLLAQATLSPFPADTPHLSVEGYRKLYEANAGTREGAHFVIHQHDHPIAGTHYDLRLQINETSSASWAIMYGPPGDPNSYKLNRNATETRIHCLWNHLIETASHATGSLLIWDTGTYTVLPVDTYGHGKSNSSRRKNDSQSSSGDEMPEKQQNTTEQEKLHQAFADRKIRLRLQGTRLPRPYVLNLRLTREEDAAGRARSSTTSTRAPKTRRRRRRGALSSGRSIKRRQVQQHDTNSDDTDSKPITEGDDDDDIVREHGHGPVSVSVSAMEREIRELEDELVRATNAYPGASNTIGSVHQRRWYLSLDRERCGFVRRRREGRVSWEAETTGNLSGEARAQEEEGEVALAGNSSSGISRSSSSTGGDDDGEIVFPRLRYPFYVRGVEHERSVVTGRLGADVLRDEGVVGYIGRKGWQAITK
ncbi:DNA polymerase ligase-domain-containing protein [Xylariaceae sp. FL0594]|nr:DNA polymerase ligase-domain-containing protein [Xylariaceae sp. FL0594]